MQFHEDSRAEAKDGVEPTWYSSMVLTTLPRPLKQRARSPAAFCRVGNTLRNKPELVRVVGFAVQLVEHQDVWVGRKQFHHVAGEFSLAMHNGCA